MGRAIEGIWERQCGVPCRREEVGGRGGEVGKAGEVGGVERGCRESGKGSYGLF